MAIRHKRTTTTGYTWQSADLVEGQIGLNLTDGTAHMKKADGSIVPIGKDNPAGSNQQIQFNNSGAFGASSGLTYNGTDLAVNGVIKSTQSAGDEGGEIQLALAATNTTLNTGVAIDINQNRLRIFETGGSNRGVYVDLTAAGTGVGTNLLSGGGGISNVVEDTTPQLGGALDVNGNSIVSVSNGDITLAPNGTGDVQLQADIFVGRTNSDTQLSTNGTGDLILNTNNGVNSGTIRIYDGANGDITITPDGTGGVIIDGNEFPQTQGAVGEVLTADGSGLVEWKLPQTISAQVYNADSVTISKGQPVYVFSSTGTNISVKLAVNTGDATSAQTLGLANEDISAGATGIVVCQGLIKNVDTSAYTAGQALYLGSTAGAVTTTKPYAPNHLVYLGFVETVNAVSGRIYVRTQNGYELDEIHDVNINHNVALNGGDYLRYNNSTTLWENSPLFISDDGAPQLGGNLDVNGNSIVSVSNGDITLAPNGTGKVIISGDLQVDGTTTTINSTTLDVDDINITIAKGAANAAAANGGGITLEGPTTPATFTYASSDNSWNLNKKTVVTTASLESFVATDGTNSINLEATDQIVRFSGNGSVSGSKVSLLAGTASLEVDGTANSNITLTPSGTGNVNLDTDTVRVGDLNINATITTNGTSDLILNTNSGTNSGSITIADGANGNITIAPNGTGDVILTTDTVTINEATATISSQDIQGSNLTIRAPDTTNSGSVLIKLRSQDGISTYNSIDILSGGNGTTGQRSASVNFGGASTTGINLYGYVNGTTGGAEGSYITIPGTSNSNITIAPEGTGDLYVLADTVRIGDNNANATLTTFGTGDLILNTNSGTNSGSITIADGANGQITISPNGSGSTVLTGPSIATATATTAGVAGLTARNAPSPGASGSIRYPSLVAQKHRTDIALASMTNEPAVIAYAVRDSSSVNRIFGTHRCVYQGTGSNPYFAFDMSTDGFTTTVNAVNFGGGQANWGNSSSNYTHSTVGTGSLILNTNQGTNTGNITLVNGVNANISITPNGTGKTAITNLQYNEAVFAYGNSGTLTWTPDAANGNVQTITLTGNLTLNAFSNPVSGQTITFIITQDGTGSRTLTSTMKFAGGSKTLSTAANAIDILTVSYIGTTYYATLSKGYA